MTRWTGGCLCGGVRYEATAEPVISLACHCRDCQYVSGGGPAYVMIFQRAAVSIKHGAPQGFKPAGHIWTRSAPPWHAIDRALPCADANPF